MCLRYRCFTITLTHTTLVRTPLDEYSARRRDLYYLTTHNTHKKQTCMPQSGFEPATPPSYRPHTHALHRAAPEIGLFYQMYLSFFWMYILNDKRAARWLRHYATNRQVAGSIPDDVIEIFQWHNPSGRTMTLGSTQPLTEMSTRCISWGVKAAGV